jgi:hypothetical protein
MSRTIVSFKDVAIAYFTDGVAAVQAMSPAPAPETILRAIQHIAEETDGDNQALDLLDLYGLTQDPAPMQEAAAPSAPKTRGRKVPAPGDTRSYKVQQNGDEIPWIRVPLCTVPCTPGDEVQVEFGNGTVSVTA